MIQNPERFNIHISCEHFICWPVHDAPLLLLALAFHGLYPSHASQAVFIHLGESYLYNHLHGCDIVPTPPYSSQISRRAGDYVILDHFPSPTRYICLK